MRQIIAILPLVGLLAGCIDIPDSGAKQRPVRDSTASFTPRPEARQCLSRLGATRASFTPLPDRFAGKGCSALNTVRLEGVGTDSRSLGVTNLGSVGCPVANAFVAWARFGVDRAARQIMGSPVSRIETYGSYACRNVAGSSRRSAHATASAIDISAFVLADGRKVSVLDGWNGNSAERRFLRVVHQSACKRFGTVLGPNYNAAHANHFHVESSGRGFCR